MTKWGEHQREWKQITVWPTSIKSLISRWKETGRIIKIGYNQRKRLE